MPHMHGDIDFGPGDNQLRIQVINLSPTRGVQPELHAAVGPLDDVESELFTDENRIELPGNFGNEVLPPGRSTFVDIDCEPGLIIGTAGGVFVNREGEEVGRGEPAWASTDNGLFGCGDVVTIVFTALDDRFEATFEF